MACSRMDLLVFNLVLKETEGEEEKESSSEERKGLSQKDLLVSFFLHCTEQYCLVVCHICVQAGSNHTRLTLEARLTENCSFLKNQKGAKYGSILMRTRATWHLNRH